MMHTWFIILIVATTSLHVALSRYMQYNSNGGMGDLRKQLQQKETVYEKEKGALESIFLVA